MAQIVDSLTENRAIRTLSWRALAKARIHMDAADHPRQFWENLLDQLNHDVYDTTRKEHP